MNILVINLETDAPVALMADERLENIRRLINLGCSGMIAGEAFPIGAIMASRAEEKTRIHMVKIGGQDSKPLAGIPDPDLALDAEVGALLETLDGEAAVLLLSGGGEPGNVFVLATPEPMLMGEIERASGMDLAVTLYELAGQASGDWLQGKSLLASQPVGSSNAQNEDDEALLRERLSGLGYI